MGKAVKISAITAVIAVTICACALLLAGCEARPSGPYASEVIYGDLPPPAPYYPSAPGDAVAENKYASVDYSNASKGYVSVRFKGSDSDGDPVMKIICGEAEYTYILGGGEDAFPLTCGDGDYTVKVYRSLGGGKYTAVLTQTLPVTLENQLLPYLYPSRMVNYAETSETVRKAKDMCSGTADDLEKLKIVYSFITENITYDFKKAANVEKGYIPSVDATYITRNGICFDYSVMMAAMLRSQNIPVKLVTGYLNGTSVFHAWNEVYLKGSGWVTVSIPINSKTFRMLDTTLAASQSDADIAKKLDDPAVYAPAYRY